MSQNITLSSGTDIELYTNKNITSKNLVKGDEISLYVRRNVNDAGKTIITANTHVTGIVVNSEKAKGGGKQGSIDIVVKEIIAVDGQVIPVFLDLNNQGKDRRKEATNVGVLLFWPALFAKGGEAVIKIGTPIIVRTVQDIKFNISKLQVNKTNDVNIIYEDLIKNQLATCGEKPSMPKRHSSQKSDFAYKSSKEFAQYKRKLKQWEDCLPFLSAQ